MFKNHVPPYAGKHLLTAVLPKRFVKSLRYTNILCSASPHWISPKNRGIDSGNSFAKKSRYWHKNGKTCTISTLTPHNFRHRKTQQSTAKPQTNRVSGYCRRNEPITCIGLLISLESLLEAFFGTFAKTAVTGRADFLLQEDKETKPASESMEADVIQLLAQKGFIWYLGTVCLSETRLAVLAKIKNEFSFMKGNILPTHTTPSTLRDWEALPSSWE